MQSRWPIREQQPYHWVSYAVVKDQWKLLTNGDGSYVELYNMADDPMEVDDLKKRHAKTVQQLQKELKDWQQTLPDHPTGNIFSAERDGSSSQ